MSRQGNNIYQRKDGRWEGRYTKGRKADGSIHYGYIYRPSYKETRLALQHKKMTMSYTPPVGRPFQGTCQSWIHLWLLFDVKNRVKATTFASYSHKCQAYILPVIGNLLLNEVTTAHIQLLVKQWHHVFSLATQKVLYRLVSQCFTSAVNHRYLICNPCDTVVLPYS